ncbi:hypothetical protein M0802_001831 [Mischocyttarus mexicanus]|nr:hypothetical protein M0802_001831 [Mischocyttarus mexicanus]
MRRKTKEEDEDDVWLQTARCLVPFSFGMVNAEEKTESLLILSRLAGWLARRKKGSSRVGVLRSSPGLGKSPVRVAESIRGEPPHQYSG